MRTSGKLFSRKLFLILIALTIATSGALLTVLSGQPTRASSFAGKTEREKTEAAGTEIDLLKEAVILCLSSPKALVKDVEKQVDTLYKEVVPFQKDGIVFIPVRFVADSLGAKVDWDGKTQTASVILSNRTASLKYGSDIMNAGGKGIKLPVPVWASCGRLMAPADQLVKALGLYIRVYGDLIIISKNENIVDVELHPDILDEIASRVRYLPVVGSYDRLRELVMDKEDIRLTGKRKIDEFVDVILGNGMQFKDEAQVEENVAMVPEWEAADTGHNQSIAEGSSSVGKTRADDYSTTNVQVQGVDEADIVKTDGEYIYQVNRQGVIIIKAYPAYKMKIAGNISFYEENFIPQELYLHGDKLIVTGTSTNREILYNKKSLFAKPGLDYMGFGLVKTMVFDISDKADIKKIREIELDGSYISSRKTGSFLYIVVNKGIDPYLVLEKGKGILPVYRDSLLKDEFIDIGYDKIYYFPDMTECSYLLIAALNVDSSEEPVKVSAYLGAGQNIYVSQENMYVALTGYSPPKTVPDVDVKIQDTEDSARKDIITIMPRVNEFRTVIYKFALSGDSVTYVSKGEVPGTILNQFSMDEYEENFRIATTLDGVWKNDSYTSSNNMYVLDKYLKIVGKIEDIAPGERIYSVRFMGKRAYMVTFRVVDPLFVIDLEKPSNPRILGALKIPGYSDYLHPYDDNHIIGFGKDTVEVKGGAYYQGLKIALFDVSDVSNPKQKFVEIIGDRGTDSELLRNHKALLFSKNKNLMAFPVTLMEVGDGRKNELDYGRFTFQGAYVYNIDPEEGFKLKGRITHLSDEDYLKSGDWGYNEDRSVERILYIDDTLYTLSKELIKAHNLNSMKEINSLELEY